MGFWSSLGRSVLGSATGGIYSGGGGGGKMPKMEGEDKKVKATVGKTKQAGGAQIKYNTEEMVDASQAPRTVINPVGSKPANKGSLGFKSKPGGSSGNFYTGGGGGGGDVGFKGAKSPSSPSDNYYTKKSFGMRSSAAKRLIKPQQGAQE